MRHDKLHLKEFFPFLGDNGCDPTVELYLPENLEALGRQCQKRPCLIICPGGGYRIVCRKESEPVALHFLPEGFNVFVLTYSTMPNHYPTQHREVAAILELIHSHAEDWNCDTGRIALMGFSAGGHLAGHYANCYDAPQIREVFPDSKPVNASLLCYAALSADPSIGRGISATRLSGHNPMTPTDREFFSCEKQVTERTPPTFLWHCSGDASVSPRNSLAYANALSLKGVPFEMHIYPHGKHDLITGDMQTNNELPDDCAHASAWLPAAKNWLKLTLDLQ